MWEHQLSEYFQISFDMDIYSCFLAISILKISDAVFSFQCPVQSHWKHRADNICGSNSSYFCLYDKNNKTFVEFCRDHPDFEAPGKKIIVEGSTQETLQGAKCSSDFYQPFKFVTNGSYGCVLTKSYCNEEGQVVYGYGTTKNDTLCRCDYTRGYYFTIPPKQTCYCVPSEEDCSCHLKLCPPNYNLTQDYECLKVTERNTSFYCESIHSVVLPKDSEILLSTNNSSLESYVLVRANMQCVRVVVLVLVLIISVIILISCVVVLLIQKDYSNRMKHLDSIKAEPDSQSLPANMQNIDNGVCHPNITCDICGEKGIHGLRWKCCDCHDFDMCSPCYMADKHDLKHAFVRVDTPNSTAFNVPTRSKSGSNKKTAKGIFPNAEVMRGPHWKWKNDDGGEGGVGLVKALETWGKDSYRGAVKISWKADNLVKNYRVGGEGCVDVIYTRMTETASGGNYYADHLPFVDVVNPGQILLKIGDKVVITLPLKGFRQLQDNQAYGGWDDDMNQCLEETGTIVGFLYNGMSVKVQYEDSKTWVINKVALTRKHTFTQGDPVTILDNYNAVKELQKGHGGWNDEMKTALGKNGRIVRLDSDGDMRIKIGDKTWIFNPACIMPIDDASTAKSIPVLSRQDTRDHSDDESETGSEGDEGGQAVAEAIAQLFVAMLREGPGTEEENDSIVEAAAKGEFDVVKKIVKKHPDKINTKMEGKTALQLACYEGHSEIVEFLVKNKADVNIKDSEGDPALHYAAYGKESKILQVLLDNKAIVNAVNAKKQSALHIAVNKGQPNCCKVLVDKGCDPNLKDDDFDTAMHDAISQKDTSKDILKYVLGSKMAKFTTENSRGFNVLHWAVLKDNKDSVEMIIGNDRTCVNSKMKDGSTAMHIAAANDRVEIASVLQSKGNADMNIRDSMKRTPLILAVSQGKKKTMELLITVGCDVNAQDSSGNTALHVAQVKKKLGQAVALDKAASSSQDTAIICSLIESGANIEIKNDEGKTPLDFANDEMVKHFMKTLAKRAKKKDFATTAKGIPAPSNWSDMHGETVLKISIGPTKGGIMQIEFDNVKHLFEKTLPQARIMSIHRMQNMFLWEMYYLRKRQLEHAYGNGCANELTLFHGTTPDKLGVIAEQNLDPRLAGGRVGALFGRGTYFATDAKYSDLYAQADHNGHKFMFLVKVLAGKTCIGRPEYLRPPPQDTKNPNSPIFDSCVDNEKNPRIYCAFHDSQYYPEYLIEYT